MVKFLKLLPFLLVASWFVLYLASRKKKLRKLQIAKRLTLILLIVLIAVWVAVNLFLWWQGNDSPYPYSPRYRCQFYPMIEKKFTGIDGKFDYLKYEVFVNNMFDLLDEKSPSKKKEEFLKDLNGVGISYYIYYIETLPSEKIQNLIPLLKKHRSDDKVKFHFGGRFGMWPGRGYGDGFVTLGDICTEVLRAHRTREAGSTGQ